MDLCSDEANCATATGYWYDNACNEEEQTATCSTDLTLCSDETNCIAAGGHWYDNDCNSKAEETSPAKIPSTTLVTAAATQNTAPAESACTPNLQCGDWQECLNGTQIRICADSNNCNPDEVASTESQACTVPIKETCFDGIKNQDETKVDCGGVCKKCSIFTIVGDAISPVGNKTNIFIFSGALLLVIGGIVCFKILKKRKKKQN
ncbi:Uncharacterised protein [uncultured archaeon]|nr:Uncharacterised protein [uncultured archaeon]